MKLSSDIEVEFRKETHQYFRHGLEYISQSKFVKIFEPGFDPKIVHASAKARGITSEVMQKEWDLKRDMAGVYGTGIHDVLERSWYGQKPESKYELLVDQVRMLIQPSKQQFPEKIFYLDHAKIAGTADLPCERCIKGGSQVLDIYDYKTNIAKGITLYNAKFQNGKWSHYDSRFLGPISHLEYTLFNKYALQLSLYMYMAEYNYAITPGRMGIIHIDPVLEARLIPVPYMKYEIEAMINYYLQLKPVA